MLLKGHWGSVDQSLCQRHALLNEHWVSVVQTFMPKACVVKGALEVGCPNLSANSDDELLKIDGKHRF